jgi:heme oxygenase
MNLKELTKENHMNAERQAFVKQLMGGEIDPKLYARYLYNQFPAYEILEIFADQHKLLDDIPNIKRRNAILSDFVDLWGNDEPPKVCPSTEKYLLHLKSIMDDPNKIMAHIYVRHMGDLSGGQMISKRIPGEGRYYKFDCDVNEYKDKIRAKCNDDMAEEAKICFDYATELFKEMMQYVEQ